MNKSATIDVKSLQIPNKEFTTPFLIANTLDKLITLGTKFMEEANTIIETKVKKITIDDRNFWEEPETIEK